MSFKSNCRPDTDRLRCVFAGRSRTGSSSINLEMICRNILNARNDSFDQEIWQARSTAKSEKASLPKRHRFFGGFKWSITMMFFRVSFLFLAAVGGLIVFPFYAVYCEGAQKIELSLGLGAAFPGESSPLNVIGEPSLSTSASANVSIRWPVGDLMFVGLRGFLVIQNLSGYQYQPSGSTDSKSIDFRLTSTMLAVDTKIYLMDSREIAPYLLLAVAYSAGSISSGDLGNLAYHGFSGGGGFGIWFRVSRKIGVSFEGLYLPGNAKWKHKPSLNSSSDEYDPPCAFLSMNVSFLINK
jgi:hypothetical protein